MGNGNDEVLQELEDVIRELEDLLREIERQRQTDVPGDLINEVRVAGSMLREARLRLHDMPQSDLTRRMKESGMEELKAARYFA